MYLNEKYKVALPSKRNSRSDKLDGAEQVIESNKKAQAAESKTELLASLSNVCKKHW